MPEPASPTVPATAPSDAEGTAEAATAEAGALRLGDLAQRINAAWPDITSYRVAFTTSTLAAPTPPASPVASPVATPVATPAATPVSRERQPLTFIREVVMPDQQRQQVSGSGRNDHEAVTAGGELFIRGPLANLIAPGTPADVWIEIDPATVPADSELARLLGGLPQPPPPPLASLPERLWPQELRDLGPVEFDGRDCEVYGAADTVPATGMRVDYEIAVDGNDIPCYIETSAGGLVQGREEFSDIDVALRIATPAAATPALVPAALATPSVRD